MNPIKIKGPILIIGSQGLLGSEFVTLLRDNLSHSQIIPTTHAQLDITNPDQIQTTLSDLKPLWVINTAAYTQVDLAEVEREKALAINAKGPKFLAKFCSDHGAKLIHFSTDYVFNGNGIKPWTESDKPEPVVPNWYGETKLLGEQAVMEFDGNLVCRVQWLYGSKQDRFSAIKNKNTFTPFSDQFGAPTWTRDIVRWVLAILSKEGSGLFHLAYDDYASWYEVYEFVKKKLNLSVDLIPSFSSELRLPAKRPLNGRLSNKKLIDFLGLKSAGSWKESLSSFLEESPR